MSQQASRFRSVCCVTLSLCTAAACSQPGGGARSLPAIASNASAHGIPAVTPHRRTSPEDPHATERAGVIAVVRRYYATLNALHRDMNAARLAALFTPTCPCRMQARAVAAAASRHERYVDHALVNVMRPSLAGPTHASVLVNLDTTRGGLVAADGAVVTSAPPRQHVERIFRLVYVNHTWLIDRIDSA